MCLSFLNSWPLWAVEAGDYSPSMCLYSTTSSLNVSNMYAITTYAEKGFSGESVCLFFCLFRTDFDEILWTVRGGPTT